MTIELTNADELSSMEVVQAKQQFQTLWRQYLAMLERAAADNNPIATRQLQDIKIGIYTSNFSNFNILFQEFISKNQPSQLISAAELNLEAAALAAAINFAYTDSATIKSAINSITATSLPEFQNFNDMLANIELDTAPSDFQFDEAKETKVVAEEPNAEKLKQRLVALVAFKHRVKQAKAKLAATQAEIAQLQQDLVMQKQQEPMLKDAIEIAEACYSSTMPKALVDEVAMTQGVRSIINTHLSNFIASNQQSSLTNFNKLLTVARSELASVASTTAEPLQALTQELQKIKHIDNDSYETASKQVQQLTTAVSAKFTMQKLAIMHQQARMQKVEVKKARKNLAYQAFRIFKNVLKFFKRLISDKPAEKVVVAAAKQQVAAAAENDKNANTVDVIAENKLAAIKKEFITFLKYDGSYTESTAESYAKKDAQQLTQSIQKIMQTFSIETTQKEHAAGSLEDNKRESLGKLHLQTLLIKLHALQVPGYFTSAAFQTDMQKAVYYWNQYCISAGVTPQAEAEIYNNQSFERLHTNVRKLVLDALPIDKPVKTLRERLSSIAVPAAIGVVATTIVHATPTKMDDIALVVVGAAGGYLANKLSQTNIGQRVTKKISQLTFGRFFNSKASTNTSAAVVAAKDEDRPSNTPNMAA